MAITAGSKILQTDMAALATLANSKTTLPKYVNAVAQSGATRNYAFPDWPSSARPEGAVWSASTLFLAGAIIVDSNGNWQQITVSGITGLTHPVWATTAGNTTNDGGAKWKMLAVAPDTINPMWLTELNRLRQNLFYVVDNEVTNGGIYIWDRDNISGGIATSNKVAGWPIPAPTINTKNLAFWYVDNGSPVTATISTSGAIECSGEFSVVLYNSNVGTLTWRSNSIYDPAYGGFMIDPVQDVNQAAQISQKTFSILVGGTDPVLIQSDFVIPIFAVRGSFSNDSTTGGIYGFPLTADFPLEPPPYSNVSDLLSFFNLTADTGALPTPSVDTTNWMASSTTTIIPITYGVHEYSAIRLRVNGMINPGRYSVVVSVPTPDDSYTTGSPDPAIWGTADGTVVLTVTQPTRLAFNNDSLSSWMYGYALNSFNPPTTYGSGNAAATSSTLGPGVDASGIHNSKAVLKIDCSSWFLNYPFGITRLVSFDSTAGAWARPPYPTPTFTEVGYNLTATFNTTIAGYWTGKSPAVNNLKCSTIYQMPWNVRVKKSGAGAQFVMVNPMLAGDLAPNYPISPQTARISNSYDNASPVELQAEPPAWAASTYFNAEVKDINGNVTTPAFVIMDSNGNIWKCIASGTSGSTSHPTWTYSAGDVVFDGTNIDGQGQLKWQCVYVLSENSTWIPFGDATTGGAGVPATTVLDTNNILQKCIVSGKAGGAPPTWSQVLGGKTIDGTITWQVCQPTKIKQQSHRSLCCVPKYPAYWQSETKPYFIPPASLADARLTAFGSNSQWFDATYGWKQNNLALGGFIYSVSVNRIGVNVVGDSIFPTKKPTGENWEIPVTIGCIRSGVFVAFATINTGQTIQVLWPIFTSDALCYQASERVDVQALAISAWQNPPTTGAAITGVFPSTGFPIAATYVSDVVSLLNKLT